MISVFEFLRFQLPSSLKPTSYVLSIGLIAMSLAIAPLQANEIYKYQDENGVWHFSERRSNKEGEFAIKIESTSETEIYKNVLVKEISNPPGLMVINNYYGPIQAFVSVECEACEIPEKTGNFVIPARSKEMAFRLNPQRRNWRAEYILQVVLGDPKAKPDSDAQYLLPLPDHREFMITQGFNGPFSHQDELSLYSLDIAMPIATPVMAARGGIVMAIEESNTEAGTDPAYGDKANNVYVLHDDGTIGVYAHLDMFSVAVKPGAKVNAGDMLARSGNTGFSTGPHLHFSVWTNEQGEQKSVYHQYTDGKGGIFQPHAGHLLTQGLNGVEVKVAEDYQEHHQESLSKYAELAKTNDQIHYEEEEQGIVEKAMSTGKSYLDTIGEWFN